MKFFDGIITKISLGGCLVLVGILGYYYTRAETLQRDLKLEQDKVLVMETQAKSLQESLDLEKKLSENYREIAEAKDKQLEEINAEAKQSRQALLNVLTSEDWAKQHIPENVRRQLNAGQRPKK